MQSECPFSLMWLNLGLALECVRDISALSLHHAFLCWFSGILPAQDKQSPALNSVLTQGLACGSSPSQLEIPPRGGQEGEFSAELNLQIIKVNTNHAAFSHKKESTKDKSEASLYWVLSLCPITVRTVLALQVLSPAAVGIPALQRRQVQGHTRP